MRLSSSQQLGLGRLVAAGVRASQVISGQLCTSALYESASAARFLRSQTV
jgi:hypothetical protein